MALCELVEGTLVEKPMGVEESYLAGLIITFLNNFVLPRKLGMVLSPDGMLRLFPGLVRAPDVSFIARRSYPGGKRPKDPIAAIAPDLAVEILSKSNSKKEMERKVREYFEAGTRLVWLVDPRKKSVKVFTTPGEFVILTPADHLDGGDVLPGLRVAIKDLFDRD
jgi:Uma2 family endonuclease